MRGIEGMAEITWARVEKRRTEYEAWTDARLTLDTAAQPPERLLARRQMELRLSRVRSCTVT